MTTPDGSTADSPTGAQPDGLQSQIRTLKKRPHTRSKWGCARCKRRHTRCDEQHPSCLNCIRWGVECVYPARIDGSWVPGMLAPWRLEKPLPESVVDPFDSLPVKMTYKSRSLLHHFAQVQSHLADLLPREANSSFISFAAEDPPVFRCILLTAASHYAAKAGGLHDYEQTFRLHMAETVHLLNERIRNDINSSVESVVPCANLITALCAIETRVGNRAAAKAHRNGLLAILDLADLRWPSEDGEVPEEVEHVEHCMILADTFLAGLWNHTARPVAAHQRAWPVQQYHVSYSKERDRELQALGLIPYFINKLPSVRGPRVMNVEMLGISARSSTNTLLNERLSPVPEPADAKTENYDSVAISIGDNASRLLTWFGNDSTASHNPSSFATASVPIFISAEQYYRRIIGTRPGQPEDPAETIIQWRKLRFLQRYLAHSEDEMKAGGWSSAFWLHEAFCGLMGNAIFQDMAKRHTPELQPEARFEKLHTFFAERVRMWAEFWGVTKWEEARKTLVSVLLWPESPDRFVNEALSRRMWDEAVGNALRIDAQVMN